jgi:putative ATP-binding cassette transporter
MTDLQHSGGFFRRLKLVGQPYWFGDLRWNWWKCLILLVVAGALVYGLNEAVHAGKVETLRWFQSLDAATILSVVNQYWTQASLAVGAVVLAVWYIGAKLGFDSPADKTKNGDRDRYVAWSLLIVVFVFMVVVNIMNVLIANVSQAFNDALNAKDELSYWKWLYCYAMIFISAIAVVGTNEWVRSVLGAHWRRWLTFDLTERYLSSATRAYYYINGRSEVLDNPDERLHQDVRDFCEAALVFLIVVLGSLIKLVAFSRELWEMSQQLTYVVLGYALAGTIITVVIGRQLGKINGWQLKYEANFRFSLTRTRENTESIAFYGGEAKELDQTKGRFAKLYRNYFKLIGAQRNLGFFTSGFDYVVVIVPALFLAPLYFKGQIDVGAIGKATFSFNMVLGSLSLIIARFTDLATFSANVQRIGTFVEAVENPVEIEAEHRIVTTFGDTIKFEDVTIRTPDGSRTLISKPLSFELLGGTALLIVGPSGCGKSSILRVVNGLWNNGSGRVTRPEQRLGLHNIFFLAQKPYMTLGSLKEQIVYPLVDTQMSIDELKQVLAEVNLASIVENVRSKLAKLRSNAAHASSPWWKRLLRRGGLVAPVTVDSSSITDAEVFAAELNWQDVLSGGEQQRLALARLLVFKPRIAILDEATSALDDTNQALFYGILRKMASTSGTSFMSVGHNPTLPRHHDFVLALDGKGGGEVMSSADYIKQMAE